jgi:chemotaxis protein methyltransferase CheR
MTPEPAAPEDLARFRALLAQRLGLAFEEARLEQLAAVLRTRMARHGGAAGDYLDRLERDPTAGELGEIARSVTVSETYFFRHAQQFDALRALLATWRGAAPPRILSAGCASGEEPYSLAIMLRERWPEREPSVVAADVNPAVLERAREARYSAWSLRETPPHCSARWFRASGRELSLDDDIRRSVRFVRANFATDEPELLSAGAFDVIFCRNILMYFTPECARAAVARLARALVPDGHLFLGSAETLRGISDDFHLCHSHDAFYYQRKSDRERALPVPTPARDERSVEASAGGDWALAIERAAARITQLAGDPPVVRLEAGSTGPASLGVALDLLHRERFAEALGHVRALPADARDPEALLLEAVLLASSSQFAEAEAVCRRLLQLDELNAGAHYVLALCDAAAGCSERAVYHDRVALYLDPAFAMPRLHLGLLLRRSGDRAAARLELGHARALLEREDGARLLMFGGGFSRAALLALCNAELQLTRGS